MCKTEITCKSDFPFSSWQSFTNEHKVFYRPQGWPQIPHYLKGKWAWKTRYPLKKIQHWFPSKPSNYCPMNEGSVYVHMYMYDLTCDLLYMYNTSTLLHDQTQFLGEPCKFSFKMNHSTSDFFS